MSPFRPDLVDCWIFRLANDRTVPGPGAGAGPTAPSAPDAIAGHAGAAAPGGETSGAATEFRRGLEILLMRRSPGRILPGLWQCVSGSLEPDESPAEGALRELAEETGLAANEILGFYDLDQVNQFHEPSHRAIVSSAVFAVRVAADAEPRLSHEHDDMRWVSVEEALELAVWPAYRESIHRIVENLVDPARAIWFELTLAGERAKQ
jgi:8-oxo-dGTP pyrophosphatase MutT (NUDIX family)